MGLLCFLLIESCPFINISQQTVLLLQFQYSKSNYAFECTSRANILC